MKELAPQQSTEWAWNIRKIYLFQFLANFHLISGILIPFFTMWGRLTFFEIMCLESYFTVMVLIFEIPCGAISDYLSRRVSIILAGIVLAISALIYSSYPSIIIFVIGETLWAFSAALISGTDQALIYDSLKKGGNQKEINRKMATLQTFLLLGMTISAPIGSIIGQIISLPFVMFIMIIPFSLAAVVGLSLKEPNDNIESKPVKKYKEILTVGFNELIDRKELRDLGFNYLYVEVIVFFLFWTYQPYLELLEVNLALYGFIAAGMTISQVIFTNIVPKLESSIKNRNILIRVYTAIPALGFVFMGIIHIPWISIMLILIVVGFGFSRKIFFIRAINTQITSEERATVLSTINMFGSLARAIFYPLVGYFVMWSLNFTFIALGTLILLNALLLRIKNEYFEP